MVEKPHQIRQADTLGTCVLRRRLSCFLVVLVLFSGCRKAGETAAALPEERLIDGRNALELTRQFVALGPRPAGSPQAAEAAEWIAGKAENFGYEVEVQEWREQTDRGEKVFRNVRAVLEGSGDAFIVAASHYDTKRLPEMPDFSGANDSGSSTALLLTVMKTLRREFPEWDGASIEFVFFDGEEAVASYGPRDGLHGSRYYARQLKQGGRAADCRAMLLLDMVGDRDLNVTFPKNNDKTLLNLAFSIAEERGVRDKFGYYLGGNILDDHVPFQRLGIPVLNFIDFEYGPGNMYWHSPEDTVDKLSAESLSAVGEVFIRLLVTTAHQ